MESRAKEKRGRALVRLGAFSGILGSLFFIIMLLIALPSITPLNTHALIDLSGNPLAASAFVVSGAFLIPFAVGFRISIRIFIPRSVYITTGIILLITGGGAVILVGLLWWAVLILLSYTLIPAALIVLGVGLSGFGRFLFILVGFEALFIFFFTGFTFPSAGINSAIPEIAHVFLLRTWFIVIGVLMLLDTRSRKAISRLVMPEHAFAD